MVRDAGSYGRSFADVYDEWYRDITDVAAVRFSFGGNFLNIPSPVDRVALDDLEVTAQE